jgi:uncharacterized protein YigA (DUF484 family)
MTGDDVAGYLKSHPEFFDDYAELLGTIEVRHPHEDRAIPLSERQLLQLRERNRVLENKLRELVGFGEENDSISQRLHQATLAFIAATDLDALLQLVYRHLRETFSVPEAALRIWTGVAGGRPEFAAVSNEIKAFADSLAHPYCSTSAMFESAGWFAIEPRRLQSFAYVPLRASAGIGVLALAAEDPKRFYPDMGTLYLQRLGDVIAGLMSRYV